MANILTTYASGATLYYVIVDSTGRIWNGSLFETFISAHWLSYVLPLNESSPPGTFEADFPSAIHIADTYSIIAYQQIGVSPSVSDPAVRAGSIGWDGFAEVPIGGGFGGGGGSNFEESFEIGAVAPYLISILAGVEPVGSNIEILTGVTPA